MKKNHELLIRLHFSKVAFFWKAGGREFNLTTLTFQEDMASSISRKWRGMRWNIWSAKWFNFPCKKLHYCRHHSQTAMTICTEWRCTLAFTFTFFLYFSFSSSFSSCLTLREKCPNTEFFLVRMWENTDQNKFHIWTLFTQSHRMNTDKLVLLLICPITYFWMIT